MTTADDERTPSTADSPAGRLTGPGSSGSAADAAVPALVLIGAPPARCSSPRLCGPGSLRGTSDRNHPQIHTLMVCGAPMRAHAGGALTSINFQSVHGTSHR